MTRSFEPFVVAAAGVVLVAVILIGGGDPAVGPQPSDSPTDKLPSSPTPVPSPTLVPSPTPTVALLEPGDTVTIDAVDAEGTWGTITLTRGEDSGGRSVAGGGFFLIQVFVDYDARRLPSPEEFGASDWTLRPTDPDAVHFFVTEPANTADIEVEPPQPPLVHYPEAVVGADTPTEGWIVFEVPIREANLELELLYWPLRGAPAASILVREPGPAPSPAPTPTPTPGEPRYVEREGLPLTVLDSGHADTLFDTPDTCENPEVGYSVTFPDDWYTNTAIGETAACSWFTPDFFEVTDLDEVPDEIWISISLIDGSVAYTSLTEFLLYEELLIDGMPARRVEFDSTPNDPDDQHGYHYVINLGAPDRGPTFLAFVRSDAAADYELGKAVLDRIMALIEFEE